MRRGVDADISRTRAAAGRGLERVGISIQNASSQLSKARQEIEWARLELERCERLATLGLPAPLEEARAAMRALEKRQTEALASLHAMGYRARFR